MKTDAVTRTVYATDNSIYQIEPYAVSVPQTAGEVVQLLRANAASAKPRSIVARGGGTGTNGQSLTDGLMIDLKRHMNQLSSVDLDSATAWVEPGLVAANLNSQLAEHGLFWPPHTSTLNRATVGGMISTDAAGKGSLVYGRASNHVLELDVVLDDGSKFLAKPTSIADAENLATKPGRVGQLWRSLLGLGWNEDTTFDLPELARGFSGYGIDRFRRAGMIDPIPLLCGAEGTLGIITRAKLQLSPVHKHSLLIVARYDSFAEGLTDAVELARLTKPTAIESFDETTLESGRSSPSWPALGAVLGEHRGSVLLLEYSGDHLTDEAPIREVLAQTGRSRASATIKDAADQASVWKVRADAVGLLAKVSSGGPNLSARPTAFVEDCAVPVAEMPAFIEAFRLILDRFGLEYAMFGHADVGCVHVRPALDTTDPGHEVLVGDITNMVVELVRSHGGILWGEHGRGFRGNSVASFLDAETILQMRQVKTAFDPGDLMNPGKLYRPIDSNEPLVELDEVTLRGQVNRGVPVEIRKEYEDAFACNGNGLCHHYGGAEVMCPSYKATGDPALSPKGRADLIRAWLRRSADGPSDELSEFEDAIAENLHQCLSCSACTGHCPVEVDITELKSQFLHRYYHDRRRPPSHLLLSRFESLAFSAALSPRLVAIGSRPLGRLLGLVDLPAPARGPRPEIGTFDPSSSTDLVILPDVFSAALEPAVQANAITVLESLDYSVSVAKFVPTGKFDHVKGKRQAFASSVAAQAELVRSIAAAGSVPVVLEPAVGLLHRHEYPAFDAAYPRSTVRFLDEVLLDRLAGVPASFRPTDVTLMGHCTERATSPKSLENWVQILTAAGHRVQAPDIGCCGMAGIFGHEPTNQPMSRSLWELTWKQPLSASQVAVATGYSCRTQAKRMAGQSLSHPVQLL